MSDQADTQFHGDDELSFVQQAQRIAKLNGACVLEFLSCPRCGNHQSTAHSWAESIPCGECGTRMPSRVPRMPQPGEVNADMLIQAIHVVRASMPRPDPNTMAWLEKQEGAVRSSMMTFGAEMVHRALDAVQNGARVYSQGHGPRGGGL